MTPIEIIAVVFSIIILVKFVFIMLIKPKGILQMIKKMYMQKALMTIMVLVMIVVLLKYLLLELTVPQIFVAAVFGMMLYALLLVQHPKTLFAFAQGVLKEQHRSWLPWLIFLGLSVWVLYSIFG